jgi:hypothetical protein
MVAMQKLHRSDEHIRQRPVWAENDKCCATQISTLRADCGLSVHQTPRSGLGKKKAARQLCPLGCKTWPHDQGDAHSRFD